MDDSRKVPTSRRAEGIVPSAVAHAGVRQSGSSDPYPAPSSLVNECGSAAVKPVRLQASFASRNDDEPQVISFANWENRGSLAVAVVAAFEKLHAHQGDSSRYVQKTALNRLLTFLNEIDPRNKIAAIGQFTQDHVSRFKEYLERLEIEDKTRKAAWAAFRHVVMEMVAASHQEGQRLEPLQIQQTPWPLAGARGSRRTIIGRDPEWELVFPRRGGEAPQVLDFAPWRNRGPFGQALVRAFNNNVYNLGEHTRIVRRVQLNQL